MKQVYLLASLILGFAKSYGQDSKLDSAKLSVESEQVWTIVENPAEFPGGPMKLMDYIHKNTKYPKAARKAGITGKVFIEFTINKDGSIDDESVIVIPKSAAKNYGIRESNIVTDNECEQEAIRLFKSCPDWTPATQHNRAVRMKMIIPVKFG